MKRARAFAMTIVVLAVASLIYLQWIGDKPREGTSILYLARVTESSDKSYQDAIKKANGYETKGQIEAASREYLSATKINRCELPSYYPLLQSAKLNLWIGKREEGIQQLEHFIDYAREELHLAPTKRFMVQNATPEHEANLRTQLAEAEELLKKQKSSTQPGRCALSRCSDENNRIDMESERLQSNLTMRTKTNQIEMIVIRFPVN